MMLLAHGSSPEAYEPTAERGGAGQPSQDSGLRSAWAPQWDTVSQHKGQNKAKQKAVALHCPL